MPAPLGQGPLEQRIKTLEALVKQQQQQLDVLKRSGFLRLAANQVGPLPGYMRAVQINDVGLANSMWMNFAGNKAGSAPYSAVTDANKTVRAEWGNLAANGVSPAQFGFRANDATGAPLFDSLGVVSNSVVTLLGETTDTTGASYTSTTATLFPGTPVTFSLTRQTNLLVAATVIGSAANDNGLVDVFIDGVGNLVGWMQWGNNGPTVTSSITYVVSQPAGNHTVDLRGRVATGGVGHSFNLTAALLNVCQLGN